MDQSSRPRASSGAPMSLEALLDEENREVLAQLSKDRSKSSKDDRQVTTPPPIRSLLDIDSPATIRHGSIAGIGVGITDPRAQRKPSRRLDPSDPSTWTKPHSPPPSQASVSSVSQPTGLPKVQPENEAGFEAKYNFDMASMPTTPPSATSSPGGRPRPVNASIAEALSADFDKRPTGASPVAPVSMLNDAVSPTSQNTTPSLLSPESPGRLMMEPGSDRRFSDKSSSFSDGSGEFKTRSDVVEEEDEEAVEISDEEDEGGESGGESPDAARGRTRTQSPSTPKIVVHDSFEEASPEGNKSPPSKPRSLLDPVLGASSPPDRKISTQSQTPGFGRSGPTAADFEDQDDPELDIQRAKNMSLNVSETDDSIPNRHVRMIIRGEWVNLQEQVENYNHTSRTYLACTDLSTEASYAMEWTVGTMLRDGDTLLAVYAIEDETAPKEVENSQEVRIESEKAAHDAEDAIKTLTRRTTAKSSLEASPLSPRFTPVTEAERSSGSLGPNATKKERERVNALDDIMGIFLKLIRRTTLQVRCMIEVIHCKSPKHLILNAIDTLEPTLCVVGTRGRSSLKGVLLGSFSNYLVTKSSVPVMVARKRLKKPRHAKVNSSSIRLSNNLTNSILPGRRKSLTQARID